MAGADVFISSSVLPGGTSVNVQDEGVDLVTISTVTVQDESSNVVAFTAPFGIYDEGIFVTQAG